MTSVVTVPHQGGDAAAFDGLLAEQVGLGLDIEIIDLEDTGPGGAETLGEGHDNVAGLASSVLLDADQSRDTETLDKGFPLGVAGRLGRHHDDIDVLRRDDQFVSDSETVGEVQSRAFLQVLCDMVMVDIGLDLIGKQHQDDIGVLDCIIDGSDVHAAVLLGLLPGRAVLPDTDGDVKAGVPEAQGLCTALRAVAEHGDLLSFQDTEVGIRFVVDLHGHEIPLKAPTTAVVQISISITVMSRSLI